MATDPPSIQCPVVEVVHDPPGDRSGEGERPAGSSRGRAEALVGLAHEVDQLQWAGAVDPRVQCCEQVRQLGVPGGILGFVVRGAPGVVEPAQRMQHPDHVPGVLHHPSRVLPGDDHLGL